MTGTPDVRGPGAETYTVRRLVRPPNVTVSVPGSKSVTNRALILAALSDGCSTLFGALDSQDTRVMTNSLQRLGFKLKADEEMGTVRVEGMGGAIPAAKADLFLENSGTSIRFLTALCSLGEGPYSLDGGARMRLRPQADLLDALTGLGTPARSLAGTGSPPILVEPHGGLRGGRVQVGSDASSQFLSALLMVAPYAREDVALDTRGTLRPHYVELTVRMMEQWGVTVATSGQSDKSDTTNHFDRLALPRAYHVRAGQRYRAQPAYAIEPDASSASYFFGAAALTGGRVTVNGLRGDSLQGDIRFATEVLPAMGCTTILDSEGLTVQGPAHGRLKGVTLDMSAISDTSITLAALAPFASTPTTVSNIAHTRLQECDRISAVCAELTKLGVRVDERPDGWTIYPVESIAPGTVLTYNDHRIAMSFALIGLRAKGIVIDDPGCVAKTFPHYWDRLQALA